MGNLTNILNFDPGWTPAPEDQMRIRMEGMDLYPGSIVLDGVIHRFSTKPEDTSDTAGWYMGFPDGVPAGAFGNWRTGDSWTWTADMGRDISPLEKIQNANRMAEAKRRAQVEREHNREYAAAKAHSIWSGLVVSVPEHPYLQKKGIEPHIARTDGAGNIVLPLIDINGDIWSLQFISADGTKRFLPGGATKGNFAHLGGQIKNKIYVAEGFATAATVVEVTKTPCLAAYSAGNLVPVVEAVRSKYPAIEIVIVADHDASGVGKNHADQAAAKFGATVIMPPIEGMDVNDYRQAGEDVGGLLMPRKNEWLSPIDDWLSQPAPIKWVVKGWVQTPALCMAHGPSGDGKTFVLLDMALHVATGKPDWNGCKIKPGPVAYLAGEGHHGIRSRVAAWCQEHNEKPRNMWVSSSAVDINTPAGLSHAMQYIKNMPEPPKMVIIDTLHRFLAGDENSAQDSKTMITACDIIQREFNCAVIIVHHTGVSAEAQGRARGSSSWRGAMENEISIRKENGVIKFEATKIKDAEQLPPIHFDLKTVDIHGWFDEDGDQVTSAVIHRTIEPQKAEKNKKRDGAIKDISDTWFDSGMEMVDDTPYVTGSAVGKYIKTRLNKEGATGRSHKKRLIEYLEEEGIIAEHSNGYLIIDEITAGSLRLKALH